MNTFLENFTAILGSSRCSEHQRPETAVPVAAGSQAQRRILSPLPRQLPDPLPLAQARNSGLEPGGGGGGGFSPGHFF